MSQLAGGGSQSSDGEELDYLLRRLETERFQEKGWQEPYESRGSRTVLGAREGEIPSRDSLALLPPGGNLHPAGDHAGPGDARQLVVTRLFPPAPDRRSPEGAAETRGPGVHG